MNLYRDREDSTVFVEIVALPTGMTALSRLYGPVAGNPPVEESEVIWKVRGTHRWPSRRVCRPLRGVDSVVVVGGPCGSNECVLYTMYGGWPIPSELGSKVLSEQELKESQAFWAQHALSMDATVPWHAKAGSLTR